MLQVIELFAGIGAQRRALQKANVEHQVIAISEIDKYAIRAYNAIHGYVPNLGNIKKIKKLPKADLWTYSFPCTDISLAGRMSGFEKGSGTHSSLLWEVQRLLATANDEGTLPKLLLMENVKNILSKKFKPLFDEWCKYLEDLGYKNFYQVLNAKDYGIPQNRERVFMISIKDCNAVYQFPSKINLDTKLGDYLEPVVDEKYYLSAKMIGCLADMKKQNGGFIRGIMFKPKFAIKDNISSAITTKAGLRPSDNYIVEPVITLDGKVIVPQATKDGYAIAEIGDGIYTNRCISKRGVVQKDKIPTLKTSVNDIGVVVTKDMKVLTNDVAIRRLTPLECFRLMGFEDDDYKKIKSLNISDTQAYKMAGNSIVVNCLTEIFKKLKENCGLQSLFKDVEQYIKEDKKIIVSKPKSDNFIATQVFNENTLTQKYEQLTLFDSWEEF